MEDDLKIDIFLDETNNPFAPYYSKDDFHLSSDLEEFILSKVCSGKSRKVEISFIGANDYDVKSLNTAISNTFSDHMKEDKYDYSRNNKKAIITYVIGIVVGLIYLWTAKDHAYLGGVLSIVSWVFIWTGTEVYFFENRQIKTDIRKCENILNAKVFKK